MDGIDWLPSGQRRRQARRRTMAMAGVVARGPIPARLARGVHARESSGRARGPIAAANPPAPESMGSNCVGFSVAENGLDSIRPRGGFSGVVAQDRSGVPGRSLRGRRTYDAVCSRSHRAPDPDLEARDGFAYESRTACMRGGTSARAAQCPRRREVGGRLGRRSRCAIYGPSFAIEQGGIFGRVAPFAGDRLSGESELPN